MSFTGDTKYKLDYLDTEGIQHITHIKESGYSGPDLTVDGNVILSYVDTEEPSEIIRGSSLTIQLDAGLDVRTYSDLIASDEREYLVEYYRDSVLLFTGWLNSDGFYEDFVETNWVLTLECVDGLGFLEDLSYVDDSGIYFTGNQTQLEIISNCLKRTGIEQNIYTNIDIYYTGLSTSLDALDNVYFNADRFVKDDGDTIMSCKEVLEDVLKPYGACITFFGNSDGSQWLIYKPNQLFAEEVPTFFRYSYLGVALSPTTDDIDTSFALGSQLDGFSDYHANANQTIDYSRSIGAFRISYKYGLVKSLIPNIFLQNVSGTIDDWTINDYTNLTLNASDLGVDIETIIDGSDVKNMTSDVVSLTAGDLLSYTYKYTVIVNDLAGASPDPGETQYKIKLTDGGSTYYWNITDWAAFDVMLTTTIGNVGTVSSTIVNMTALPISGDITVEIHTSIKDVAATSTSEIHLTEISLSTQQAGNEEGKKGEFHTFQRETAPSAKIKNIEKVNVGDNPSDVYYGTIYKTDGTTPTETWFRKGVTEAKPLLELMGVEALSLMANTAQTFNGDVYGYVPYFSVVDINNRTGIFLPIKYVYDTKNNITSLSSKQIYNDTLTDIDYELTYDYGNTVKPTIKG